MLTFYPEFDCESQNNYEMIILLDMSNSMSTDDVISVKKIALVLLNSISSMASFNLIIYGSSKSKSSPNVNLYIKVSHRCPTPKLNG